MIVKNHFNEEVDIMTIERLRRKDTDPYKIIQARLINKQIEYWIYDEFMLYNPDFEWGEN